MNILIPMAGRGSRFSIEGYTDPKPLIDVLGEPMISRVIKNIRCTKDDFFYFVVLNEHLEKYSNFENILRKSTDNNCKIIKINEVTEGAALTCLKASEYIPINEPVLMANSDQFLIWDPEEFLNFIEKNKDCDGIILTFKSDENIHSYASVDNNGIVLKTAEKEVISNNASCGVYYWNRFIDFENSVNCMVEKKRKYNNEFYVCPAYNELIDKNKKVIIYQIEDNYHLGIPNDLNKFIKEKGRDL